MFVGEFACLLVFKLMVLKARCSNKVRNHIRAEAFELALLFCCLCFVANRVQPAMLDEGGQQWSPFIFLIPALCDCVVR